MLSLSGWLGPWVGENKKVLKLLLALCGVFAGPLTGSLVVTHSVALEEICNVGDQRIFWVAVVQKTANGQQDLLDRQRRTPLTIENVQTYRTVLVNIAVIQFSYKVHSGRLEWIVGMELDIQ